MQSIAEFSNNSNNPIFWGQFLEQLSSNTPSKKYPPKRVKQEKKKIILMGDHQAPFINHDLHELSLAFINNIKADTLVYMGDGVDFDSISKHRAKPEFSSTVQEGLNSLHQVLTDLMSTTLQEGHFLVGNHDIRLQNILLDKLPSIFGIKKANMSADEVSVLSLRNLLRLDELNINYCSSDLGDYPHSTYEITNDLFASHGWIARKGAGNSARASIENLNRSLVVGHTHRLTVSYLTRWNGNIPIVYTAAESGTMADPRGLGYSRFPDWQSGFLICTVHKDQSFNIEPVIYKDGVLHYRDQKYWRTNRGIKWI